MGEVGNAFAGKGASDELGCMSSISTALRFDKGALVSGKDEVDDTVADWEASVNAGVCLRARRRNNLCCLTSSFGSVGLANLFPDSCLTGELSVDELTTPYLSSACVFP